MEFKKRYILLIIMVIIGIAAAFPFLNWTTSVALEAHPNWDMISFIPGNADIDNLYLIIATIPWALFAFLLSVYGARFFMFINRIAMPGRKQSIESMELEMSFTRLITRAIMPALFSFSIAAVILQYLNQFSVEFYRPIFIPPTSAENQFRPFLANALHESLLFLPITLVIFIPTWILNDFMVISRLEDAKPGEFSDPVKVGQWVSGLLGGFSVFAFPFTFVSTFLFDPSETGAGWVLLVNRIDEILIALVSVLFILLAFALPVIILYDANKTGIARRFFRIADKLGIDYDMVDTSSLSEDEPKTGAGFSASAGASAGVGFTASAGPSESAGVSGGAGFSASAGASAGAEPSASAEPSAGVSPTASAKLSGSGEPSAGASPTASAKVSASAGSSEADDFEDEGDTDD